MFIRKKDYKRLLYRLSEMEKAIEQHDEQFLAIDKDTDYLGEKAFAIENALSGFREATDDKLFAMSESITELTDNTSAAFEDVVAKLKELTDESEAVQKDRETEKAIIEGWSNIMNYGVTNGQKQKE